MLRQRITGLVVSICFLFFLGSIARGSEINLVSPAEGIRGQTIEDLIISGSGYTERTKVSFSPAEGIIVTLIRFISPMELRATITITNDAPLGPRDVIVIPPEGQMATLNNGFVVKAAAPVINSVKYDNIVIPMFFIPIKLPKFIWIIYDIQGFADFSVDGGSWQPAVVGMSLPLGTKIGTGFASKVVLKRITYWCADETVISEDWVLIGGMTEIGIGELTNYQKNKIDLAKGKILIRIFFHGPGIRVDFRVSTPRAGAVKGTRFSVDRDPVGNIDIFDILDGTIEVTDPFTSQTVTVTGYGEGRGKRVVADEAGLTVSDLSEIFARDWDFVGPLIPPSPLPIARTVEFSVLGENFAEGAVVSFEPDDGITTHSIRLVNSSELSLTVDIDILASLNPRNIIVTNPDGQNGTLNGGLTVVGILLELITPENRDVLTESDPLFKWSIAHSFPEGQPLPEVEYELKICEKRTGQTLSEAINNIPHFEERSIKATSFRYPIGANTFESNKTYCWQIKTLVNDIQIIASEIQQFNFVSPPTAVEHWQFY